MHNERSILKFYIAQWPAHAHFIYLLRRLAKSSRRNLFSYSKHFSSIIPTVSSYFVILVFGKC